MSISSRTNRGVSHSVSGYKMQAKNKRPGFHKSGRHSLQIYVYMPLFHPVIGLTPL